MKRKPHASPKAAVASAAAEGFAAVPADPRERFIGGAELVGGVVYNFGDIVDKIGSSLSLRRAVGRSIGQQERGGRADGALDLVPACVAGDIDAAEDIELSAADEQILNSADQKQRQAAQVRPRGEFVAADQSRGGVPPFLALGF